MDDVNLQARQFSEIFISTESGDQVIDDAKVREDAVAPYLNIECGWLRPDGSILVKSSCVEYLTYCRDSDFQIEPYINVYDDEDLICNDESPFVKKTEDWKRVAKHKLPAPIFFAQASLCYQWRINLLHVLQNEYRLNLSLPDNVNPYKKH